MPTERRTIEQQIADLQAKQERQLSAARARALLNAVRSDMAARDYALASKRAQDLVDELKALVQP